MSQVPRYSRYAQLYDKTGQAGFARGAWPYVRERLTSLGWQGRTAVDLACGTGAAAVAMTEDGLRVVGADLSREMLLWGAPATVGCAAQGDLRRLPFADAQFDVAVSFYDSFNYLLSTDDLRDALAEAARVLRPGGYLVIDLITPYCYATLWRDNVQSMLSADMGSIWRSDWNPRTQQSRLEVTFFTRGADGRWDRFDEVHEERGFAEGEVKAAVRAAGLKVAWWEDRYTRKEPHAETNRIFWWLRKRDER